ncbi:MAG: HAMP domain-containing sensor histidine kinase [bacterium]
MKKKTRKRATDAGERQNESAAKLAHEFRTRLAIINSAVDNVIAGIFGELSDEQKKNLQIAVDAVERLTKLVEDFMAAVHKTGGRIPLNREHLSINSLIKHTMEGMEPLAYKEGIAIKASIPRKRIEVNCDRAKIEQVFINLFRNAIKFTSRGGTITVTAQDKGDRAEISIKDTGMGIPKEKIPLLFRHPATGRKPLPNGGFRTSGLGLVIVKEILDAHGSTISVSSQLGEGSTFAFTLPKAKK